MAQIVGGEHCIQIEACGVIPVNEAMPEKQLNCFVRSVALIEKVGNALGTLAFTWATVVLLGGYPTVLGPKDDFTFATAIVFLETARIFSRNNRLDYQMFFHTRGAVRPVGWNGFLIVICLSIVLLNLSSMSLKKHNITTATIEMYSMIILAAAIRQILSVGGLRLLSERLQRSASLWSPLIAIMLLVPAMVNGFSIGKWMVFLLLFLVVLLLTVSRLRYPRITKLVGNSAFGRKLVSWHRLILNSCLLASLVMAVFVQDDPIICAALMIVYQVYALVVVSFGNFQIPAAILRIALALLRLVPHDYFGDDAKTNLGPSLCIFYGIVLGQGTLYIVACLLQAFSFFPQRSLARRVGFRGQQGLECVDLYYAYSFDKYMNGDVLTPMKISLNRFAMESLHSDSPKMQLHGVRVMHSLLQRETSKARIFAELSTSTETMTRLIRMLDWTSPKDSTVRLFAAKVTAELSKRLRVTIIPGTVQTVSALLNYGNQRKRGHPLLVTDGDEQDGMHDDSVLSAAAGNIEKGRNAVSDSSILLDEALEDSTSQCCKCWILRLRCCQWFSEPWAIPQEEAALTEQDLLPVLGMTIIHNLAGYDQDNCLEISRASGLIQKIIGFTSYCRSDSTCTSARPNNVLVKSSLKLLHRLTSINGEIGIALRHNISMDNFLLRNLATILRHDTSSQELRKLVAGILRNLVVDVNTRQAIGRIQAIIIGLMQAFLTPDGPSTTNADPLLRKVAGQALAMLAMNSVDNCLAMLRETGFAFVRELTGMIHLNKYRCVSASLLRSMCLHARRELQQSDLKELSYALREVLERMLVADTSEIEFLVGLSSQICKAVPEDFARELEHGQIKETFVKWLVDVLNMNLELNDGSPGISRSILEQAINMMEYDSGYASYFNRHHMPKALSMMEETASGSANFDIFLDDAAGLTEAGEPLSSLVARAKQLLAFQ